MSLKAVSLTDKYTLETGRVYLTGIQALTRLPLMQHRLDLANGLDTAGFISGYRGSPIATLDMEFWRAQAFLAQHHIHFQPGVNEDLAAAAVWGSQQVNLFEGARYDGTFAMWYGKGPGVDRSGDVFKHANAAGSSCHGGVLLVAGDDHGCKSSSLPHQSEYAFMDAMIPVLNPAGVQEILDFGLYGWAMSRFSGCWVALKAIMDNVNSSASVYVDPGRVTPVLPHDFEIPPEGLNIRWPDNSLDQERRLHEYKIRAATAFARVNRLDRTPVDGPRARFGIVTTGKSYLDVCQALEEFGIDEAHAGEIGIRIFKVGMSWPLDPQGARNFAKGLEEILVVEEKRPIVESQLKEILYDVRHNDRPAVIGKLDEMDRPFLPSIQELTPECIARAIAKRVDRFYTSEHIRRHIAFLDFQEMARAENDQHIERTPYYCSGCPHNTSTRVPEGSRAVAGIGCHYMVTWMDRNTETFTHMGGEGATWIGQAPFTKTAHIFQNLGDGTYFHSGVLAIRAAVAAKVNITFKILYNDAVAMTGGQPVDGPFSVPQLTRQLDAEGVRRIVVVTGEPEKNYGDEPFAPGVTIHHRKALDKIQRGLRALPGVTAIVYDQTCAAEKRHRQKQGHIPPPPARVFINEMVCEGCGDCGVQSNCLSITPVETAFGVKRAVDQSSCNIDYSCINGFCPSFVTLHGATIRKRSLPGTGPGESGGLPAPDRPALHAPFGIVIAGAGGTGVVTISALLGMAAHIEDKGCAVLDMVGLAQKGGAVISHVRIAERPEEIHATRITAGSAHLLLGCDLVVSASREALDSVRPGTTQAVINAHETAVAAFLNESDPAFPGAQLRETVARAAGAGHTRFFHATRLATTMFGDAIFANTIMLGYAFQIGRIPLSLGAIDRAIELNGVAVEANRRAFSLGRRVVHDPSAMEEWMSQASGGKSEFASSFEDVLGRRACFLSAYQNSAYADRYLAMVHRARAAEATKAEGRTGIAEAVARYYFKLLAYKDEYEVARLYSDGTFLQDLNEKFEGDFRIVFHFAPPLFPSRDPETGELRKRIFGPWMLFALRVLASLKFLRGTIFDIFGYTAERRMERQLIRDYEATIQELLAHLSTDNHAVAVEIAKIPEWIRGFGHIKREHLRKIKMKEAKLLTHFRKTKSRTAALA